MNTTDIDLLLAEKGNPCLTVIIPTHQYTRDRMQNPELIEKAIQKARKLLAHSAWPPDKVRQLEGRFDSILENIDYVRLQEGLAIFISPSLVRTHLLPFPVKEKVVLGQNFVVRDLLYYAQQLRPFLLLAVSKKRIRLFKGSGRNIQEIINDDFPMPYEEEYEYARPSIGSPSSAGLKSFERDKSIVQQTRLKSFLRNADETLHKYLKPETLLFVAGVEEELADFMEVTSHNNNLAGRIAGNYDIDAVHPLSEQVWQEMKKVIAGEHDRLLQEVREGIGKDLAVAGMRKVWRATLEGKVRTLLVGKDYETIVYQDATDPAEILLVPPAGAHNIITTAVEQLIETVREKGGKTVLLENGQLDDLQNIAGMIRYS